MLRKTITTEKKKKKKHCAKKYHCRKTNSAGKQHCAKYITVQKNTTMQKNNRYAEKLDPQTYNTKQQQKHPKQITEQLPASDTPAEN